ncbi:hypothetical protein J6590_096771 [Homalodisca vitripennis]|nr:hypothetical protein J6590_096771 [Homalodisca vitripennis]
MFTSSGRQRDIVSAYCVIDFTGVQPSPQLVTYHHRTSAHEICLEIRKMIHMITPIPVHSCSETER